MKNAMQLKAIMKKLAKENQISAQLVLQNYMLERFLERVSLSPYRDNYIIKGGFLISSMVGLNSRATMDMDATIKGYPVTQDTVQKMIEKMELFEIYTKGFLQAAGEAFTPLEKQTLPWGAKLMTMECGMRFLADYLEGDHYFHINYETQNLNRARTQFKLTADMEKSWDVMQKIIEKYC